jgi:hypothetical protein
LSDYDWIFQELVSAIKTLVDRFIEAPYFFYSEQDMHAFLYHKLISGRLGQFYVETHFGDKTVLLHREYPTLGRYPEPRGKRGRFDLAVIDPEHVSESHWRMQIKQSPYSRHKPKVAVEFGLNAIGTTRLELAHFKKDLKRLTDPRNMVERGYLLFFVRREDYHTNSGMLPIIDRLPNVLEKEVQANHDPTTNLVVLYAEALSPGASVFRVIPHDRSAWVGQI